MRKLILLPALLMSVLAFAGIEDNTSNNVTVSPNVGALPPHFANGIINTNGDGGQASWQDMRLIGKTYLKYNGASFLPIDSIIYKYSKNRGSVPNSEDPNNDEHVLFDISTTYKFSSSSNIYSYDILREQRFDNERVEELTYKKWNVFSSLWKNDRRYVYQYDVDGKMQSSSLQQWYGTLWTNSVNSILNYDNKNNVIGMNSPSYNIDFVYDNNNNLTVVEDQVYQSGIGWVNNERKLYSYSGKNIVEYTLQEWVNGNWQDMSKWEYQYDASKNVITSIEYAWGNGWKKDKMHTYTYDANGNMLTDILHVWSGGAFIKSHKETRTYNAKSQPEILITHTWSGQSWVHGSEDIQIRYYYEFYDATEIKSLLAKNIDVMVYPIPATDNVNIRVDLEQREALSISLVDMNGKIVYAGTSGATKQYADNISVNHLPSGMYTLVVSSANQRKQQNIVVRH